MTPPVWLIAGREFRTYTATVSFWVALLVGPLCMVAALLAAGAAPSAPTRAASLTLSRGADGVAEARFSQDFPLAAAERTKVLRILEQGGAPIRLAPDRPSPRLDPSSVSRLVLVMMLWMTLTGSLGMLLQAVVRERANRALESLLAAASPWDIVFGKMAGVGGVSLVILVAWLGSSSIFAGLAPSADGLAASLLQGFGQPIQMARALGIYVLAFAFYGLVTVGVGALARDNADAQNLARPMFVILLAVFFAALACAGGGADGLAWLVYLPPFTPFMLLMQSYAAGVEILAVALLAIATLGAGWLACGALSLNSIGSSLRWFVWPTLKSSSRR
ncbi:ABC transporter permease [Phenylobacterium sp.]|uniref:ABC transporter permease n=1 Tax=Phenylobacterium sp. TaxID=1871053 RepID=UPI002735882E|nr:ABC transporter permease [Phenylobacterium sp.]MDP3852257.1 ABC transporter permease [Phenylobacterium sp.]